MSTKTNNENIKAHLYAAMIHQRKQTNGKKVQELWQRLRTQNVENLPVCLEGFEVNPCNQTENIHTEEMVEVAKYPLAEQDEDIVRDVWQP